MRSFRIDPGKMGRALRTCSKNGFLLGLLPGSMATHLFGCLDYQIVTVQNQAPVY